MRAYLHTQPMRGAHCGEKLDSMIDLFHETGDIKVDFSGQKVCVYESEREEERLNDVGWCEEREEREGEGQGHPSHARIHTHAHVHTHTNRLGTHIVGVNGADSLSS